MNHIFQRNRKVSFLIPTISGTTVTRTTVDFSTSDYTPYISGYVSYSPERISKKSPIDGKIFTKPLGWRGKIRIEINIVTPGMLTLVQTLLRHLSNNMNFAHEIQSISNYVGDNVSISIDYATTDSAGASVRPIYLTNYHLVSDIEPEYLVKSVMAGESLELEFESRELYRELPNVAIYDAINFSTGNYIITSDDDRISII